MNDGNELFCSKTRKEKTPFDENITINKIKTEIDRSEKCYCNISNNVRKKQKNSILNNFFDNQETNIECIDINNLDQTSLKMNYKKDLFYSNNPKSVNNICNSDEFISIENSKDVFSNFKFNQNDDDDATKLIKKLIQIVYDYESEIVHNIRQTKDIKYFNIKKHIDEFYYFESEIGRKNIAKILGIGYSNFKRNWVNPLNKNEKIVLRFKSLLKIIHSTNKFLPDNIKVLADKVISDYLENTGKLNDLRVQIAIIFNNHVKNPLGFSDISLLLGKNRMYLNLLSENLKKRLEFEQINKYFTLLSSIFFLNENSFNRKHIKLNSPESLNHLKNKCYNLILEFMREHEIINDDFIGEFEVIFYSFLALAEGRGNSFNINDFSREITNNPKGIIFSSKLRDGWKISIEQCLLMKRLLPPDTKYYKKARTLLENYIKYRESIRESEYHTYWYDEDVIRFHCTILTIRDLCVDILSLFPFPVKCFLKSFPPESYTFNRHHFYIADKKSLDPNRIILTISQTHPIHERQNKKIRKLLNWRFKGIGDSPTFYQNIARGSEKWALYLKRRKYIEKFGIGNFILKYLTDSDGKNYFIERFYPMIFFGKGKNVFYLTEQEKMVIALNLETEIKNVLKDWADKYPDLIPKLPDYAKYILPKQSRIYKFLN